MSNTQYAVCHLQRGSSNEMLTGTHEQMMKIANDGKLGSWIDVNSNG